MIDLAKSAIWFILIISVASAQNVQPAATSPLEEVRTLLQEGLYALAAQVEGPQLIEAMPESAEAHYLYAKALYLTGDLATAQTQLEEVRAQGEPKAEYAQLEALIAAARGDLVGAQSLLEATLEQSPSYEIAMDLGRVAWQAGDFEGARRAYERAATMPEGEREPWPHLHRAKLLALEGKYEESIKVWNNALNVLDRLSLADAEAGNALPSPAYVEAFYGLGEAYEALGETEQAASNYSAALAADPSFEAANEALERLGENAR